MKILLGVLLSVLLVLPGMVSATKLYKWVDKDGKVTYQENPPPAEAAKVEEKNIDPDLNVIKSEHPIPSSSAAHPSSNTGQEATDTVGTPSKDRPPASALHGGGQAESGQPVKPEATPLPAREPPPPTPLPPLPVPPPLPQPPISPPPPPVPSPPPGGAR